MFWIRLQMFHQWLNHNVMELTLKASRLVLLELLDKCHQNWGCQNGFRSLSKYHQIHVYHVRFGSHKLSHFVCGFINTFLRETLSSCACYSHPISSITLYQSHWSLPTLIFQHPKSLFSFEKGRKIQFFLWGGIVVVNTGIITQWQTAEISVNGFYRQM